MPGSRTTRRQDGGRLEPADRSLLVLSADDEVEAASPIDIHGYGEHPLGSVCVERFGAPFAFARIAAGRRCPVDLNPPRAPLGGADDIEVAVAIGVEEDGIFTVGGFAHRDGLPRGVAGSAAIGEVDAREPALFPARDEIQTSVAVRIGRTNTVCAKRRGIDRVPRPWLSALSDSRRSDRYRSQFQ